MYKNQVRELNSGGVGRLFQYQTETHQQIIKHLRTVPSLKRLRSICATRTVRAVERRFDNLKEGTVRSDNLTILLAQNYYPSDKRSQAINFSSKKSFEPFHQTRTAAGDGEEVAAVRDFLRFRPNQPAIDKSDIIKQNISNSIPKHQFKTISTSKPKSRIIAVRNTGVAKKGIERRVQFPFLRRAK